MASYVLYPESSGGYAWSSDIRLPQLAQKFASSLFSVPQDEQNMGVFLQFKRSLYGRVGSVFVRHTGVNGASGGVSERAVGTVILLICLTGSDCGTWRCGSIWVGGGA